MELHMICNSYDNKDLLSLVYKEFYKRIIRKLTAKRKMGKGYEKAEEKFQMAKNM